MKPGTYELDVVNTSGSAIPPFSVMQLDDSGESDHEGRLFIPVTQPDGEGKLYLINGPVELGIGGRGKAANPVVPKWSKYTTGDSPAINDEIGPVDGAWTLDEDGTGFIVLRVNTSKNLVYAIFTAIPTCPIIHEFYIEGSPTSGTQVLSMTINADTQNVTIAFDDTSLDIKNAIVAAFSGVSTDDIVDKGGALPLVACYLQYKPTDEPDWPPVFGTNTMNNSAVMKLRKSGGA